MTTLKQANEDRLLRSIFGAPADFPRMDADLNCQWHDIDAANEECLNVAGVGVYLDGLGNYHVCGIHAEILYSRP